MDDKNGIKKKTTGDNNTIEAKKKKKKKMIIIIVVLTVLAGISYIFLQYPEIFDVSSWFTKEEDDGVHSMYSDRIISYNFYPSEYDVDITTNEDYMKLNTYVQYTDGAETFTITDENYAKYGKAVEFFGNYFSLVKKGDTEEYNKLFTENYYKTVEPYDKFAPQKIYDINIEKLSIEDSGNKYTFNVTYKIYRNDGTFRNDMGSDASKTLRYILVTENDVLKIDSITPYVY